MLARRARTLARVALLASRLQPALTTSHMAAPTVDPRAICERYTDDTYAKMRDDSERTSAYATAIAAAAPGRVCLDVGTGGARKFALDARDFFLKRTRSTL